MLNAVDKQQCGRVQVEELHRIIDLYCFRLTPEQWRKVKAGLNIGPDNSVDYSAFLNDYAGTEVSGKMALL
jgi:hypothetical protein